MIGGGSGRSAGAAATRGVIRDCACVSSLAAPRDARGLSGARGEPSPLTRRRSIAARARSLASRRSSGATAVSTGAAGAGAAATGAAADAAGCTGDGSTTLIFSFSRGAAARAARPAGGGVLAACSQLGRRSVDFASGLVSALALSAFASAFASVFSCAFSTTAGRSAAVFSMMAFSEMPLALTPAAGRLLTSAVVSAGLASGRFGFGLGFALDRRRRRSGRRVRGGLAHDVMVDDVRPDDGRSHRGQDVHRKFLQVIQHSGHSPRPI